MLPQGIHLIPLLLSWNDYLLARQLVYSVSGGTSRLFAVFAKRALCRELGVKTKTPIAPLQEADAITRGWWLVKGNISKYVLRVVCEIWISVLYGFDVFLFFSEN